MVRLCRPQHNVLLPKLSGPSVLGVYSTVVRRLEIMYKQLQGQEDASGDARSVEGLVRYAFTPRRDEEHELIT